VPPTVLPCSTRKGQVSVTTPFASMSAEVINGLGPLCLYLGAVMFWINITKRRNAGPSTWPQVGDSKEVDIFGRNPVDDGSVLVVGIAGGSGSGKTTLAAALFKALGEEQCAYIMHDSYYKDVTHLSSQERDGLNFDHPDQLDTTLLVEHIRELRNGRPVSVPTYDFATHSRTKVVTRVSPRPVVIVEGILIFTDTSLCSLLDLRVFVDTDCDVRLIRRIERDTTERGRTLASVVTQYMTTVRPMYHRFVKVSKDNADMIIPHGLNEGALACLVARLEQFCRMQKEATTK